MAEDIHSWMDEPCLLYGVSHRKVRHDFNQKIPQIFIDKYGEELARNIMTDHIILDLKGRELSKEDVKEIRYRKKKKVKFDEMIIDLDEQDAKTDFDYLWRRIIKNSGKKFLTITQREFKYSVKGDLIWPNKGKYPVTKDELKTAFDMLPFDRPSDIAHVSRGSSYLWSLLHDDRIISNSVNSNTKNVEKQENTSTLGLSSQIIMKQTHQEKENRKASHIKLKCQACAWARYLKKTENKKGPLRLLSENVYTLTKPLYANQKDVDLYCVVFSGVGLDRVNKIKRFTDDEVNKIGFFSSSCSKWISKNR